MCPSSVVNSRRHRESARFLRGYALSAAARAEDFLLSVRGAVAEQCVSQDTWVEAAHALGAWRLAPKAAQGRRRAHSCTRHWPKFCVGHVPPKGAAHVPLIRRWFAARSSLACIWLGAKVRGFE